MDGKHVTPGLYRVFWHADFGGGTSVAAVGSDYHGNRWIAPTNWTSESISPEDIEHAWDMIDRVEPIEHGDKA